MRSAKRNMVGNVFENIVRFAHKGMQGFCTGTNLDFVPTCYSCGKVLAILEVKKEREFEADDNEVFTHAEWDTYLYLATNLPHPPPLAVIVGENPLEAGIWYSAVKGKEAYESFSGVTSPFRLVKGGGYVMPTDCVKLLQAFEVYLWQPSILRLGIKESFIKVPDNFVRWEYALRKDHDKVCGRFITKEDRRKGRDRLYEVMRKSDCDFEYRLINYYYRNVEPVKKRVNK